MSALLLLFSAVVNASRALPSVTHDVLHHIITTGPPISSTFRRLDVDKFLTARAEFNTLEWEGIICRSCSPWSSPLHVVRKKDGTWRPCGDFCYLNFSPLQTPTLSPTCWTLRPGCLIVPSLARLTSARATARCQFIRPTSPRQTSRLCLSCTSSCACPSASGMLVIPFSVCWTASSPTSTSLLVSGRQCYCGQLFLSRPLGHLRLLLQWLQQRGLAINLEKCVFAAASVEFL